MTLNIADAKAKFSSLIATVDIGKDEVVISKRDKPVAVLISYDTFIKMRSLTERPIDTSKIAKLPSSLDKFIGIVTEDEIDYDYKESREEYLKEKYL